MTHPSRYICIAVIISVFAMRSASQVAASNYADFTASRSVSTNQVSPQQPVVKSPSGPAPTNDEKTSSTAPTSLTRTISILRSTSLEALRRSPPVTSRFILSANVPQKGSGNLPSHLTGSGDAEIRNLKPKPAPAIRSAKSWAGKPKEPTLTSSKKSSVSSNQSVSVPRAAQRHAGPRSGELFPGQSHP
jgi:hypothetical protein